MHENGDSIMTSQQQTSTPQFDYAVWGTQGGGLVRQVGNSFIFVTAPNCPGLKAGDTMPEDWGIAAANQAAHDLEARQGTLL